MKEVAYDEKSQRKLDSEEQTLKLVSDVTNYISKIKQDMKSNEKEIIKMK
jgi:hypothetical protein